MDTLDRSRKTSALLEGLITDPSPLGPDFEPVRRLDDRTLVAVKAHSRPLAELGIVDTAGLRQTAVATGHTERLDWAYRCLVFDAMAGRTDLPVAFTPEPETYGTVCPPRLTTKFLRARRETLVVAEMLTAAFANLDRLDRAAEEYRGWGWSLAVGDVADDERVLGHLPTLKPDVVRLDLSLPGRAPGGRHEGVAELLAYAASAGATVEAVGVDTEARLEQAVELGATQGRGRLLGPKGPLRTT